MCRVVTSCEVVEGVERDRENRFVHGAEIIYSMIFWDKNLKLSRVCTVSLVRRKSRKLKPLAFDE